MLRLAVEADAADASIRDADEERPHRGVGQDVAFDVLPDTPIGPLLVGVTDRGVCRISFDAEPEHHLELLASTFGPRVLRSSKPVDRMRRELDEYFEGRRRHFDVEPDVR